METKADPTMWTKHAMKNGLILGIIHAAILLILYAFIQSKLKGFSYILVILVLNFGWTIYQGSQWRNEIGGFMGYGDAFKYAILLLVFNGLVGLVFGIGLLLADPSFPEIMAQSQIDTAIYWAETFGAPAESLDQMRDQMSVEEMAKEYTLTKSFISFGIAIGLYGVGALIMAIFIRKNQPELM